MVDEPRVVIGNLCEGLVELASEFASESVAKWEGGIPAGEEPDLRLAALVGLKERLVQELAELQ